MRILINRYKPLSILPLVVCTVFFLYGCGSDSSSSPDATEITDSSDTEGEGNDSSEGSVSDDTAMIDSTTNTPPGGATQLIPLDTHPDPTVTLAEGNALAVASAVYRVQRAMALFVDTSMIIRRGISESPGESTAAMNLGSSLCSAGDGSAQSVTPLFAGAINTTMVSFDMCVVDGVELFGDVVMATLEDGEDNWLIVEPDSLGIQAYGESWNFQSGRLRVLESDTGLSLNVVGSSLEVAIDSFAFSVTPYEASIESTASAGSVISDNRFSVASELFGGTVFSKPSAPLALAANGESGSGGNTIRGMESTVIEWSAGVAINVNGDPIAITVTDLRAGETRTIIDATWEEFLSVF